jgi:hypothetical protein
MVEENTLIDDYHEPPEYGPGDPGYNDDSPEVFGPEVFVPGVEPLNIEPDNIDKEMDWDNDELFFTHTFEDETSQFDDDPSVRWRPGGEYYSREYRIRVPIAFKNCDELIDKFIEWTLDNHPTSKVWR